MNREAMDNFDDMRNSQELGEMDNEDSEQEEIQARRNQADRLVEYALGEVGALFADQFGMPHALVDGEAVLLTSRCHSWLRRLMWEQEERSVSSEALRTAAGTLAAHAEFSGDVRELHTRAAWHEGALYYELRPGRVVRVDGSGYGFEANPPVLFRRFPNLKPLPDPEPGGSLDVLDAFTNLKAKRDRRLFRAYVVTVALPQVQRPIANASGAMGSCLACSAASCSMAFSIPRSRMTSRWWSRALARSAQAKSFDQPAK